MKGEKGLKKIIEEEIKTEKNPVLKKEMEMRLKKILKYEKTFDILTQECNEHFDEVEAQAKEIFKNNAQLKRVIKKHRVVKNKDQKLKNDYYLFLKHEIARISDKKKF